MGKAAPGTRAPVLTQIPQRAVSTFESRHPQQTWRLASRAQEDFSLLLTTASGMWPGLGRGGELGLSGYWKRDMSTSCIYFPGFSCSLHGESTSALRLFLGRARAFPRDVGRCWGFRNSSFSYPALETVTQAWSLGVLPESFLPRPRPSRRSVDPT